MSLGLDEHGFSPGVLKMLAKGMGRLRSASDATFALNLAKIPISCSQVQRIAKEIGNEMTRTRDT
jgi:hypothetical protein